MLASLLTENDAGTRKMLKLVFMISQSQAFYTLARSSSSSESFVVNTRDIPKMLKVANLSRCCCTTCGRTHPLRGKCSYMLPLARQRSSEAGTRTNKNQLAGNAMKVKLMKGVFRNLMTCLALHRRLGLSCLS